MACSTYATFFLAQVGELVSQSGALRRPDMMKFLKLIKKNEEGATAIEYGLIAALIAVAIISAVSTVGTQLTQTFTGVSTCLQSANAKTAC
jgi:pilus assembly protein Flp/PilA